MQLTRAKLLLGMIATAVAATSVGCMAPWPSPMGKSDASHHSAAPASTPAVRCRRCRKRSADANPDMAGVLDKLEQVRALDPAAEPKLLEELRRTPPNSWPLVAEQFRATLAYHQQLAAKERTPPQGIGDYIAIRVDRLGRQNWSRRRLESNDERPSTRIGALVDPHVAMRKRDGFGPVDAAHSVGSGWHNRRLRRWGDASRVCQRRTSVSH